MPRKPAASSNIVTKPNTSVVSIRERLAVQAAAMPERVGAPGGDKIVVTQDKHFKFPDGTQSAGPFDVVIVDFLTVHKFWEGAYDPKNITPPACFAIGTNPSKMAPSDNSPVKQSDTCPACPMNQFGSADSGDGKACKNMRSLAVLPPDADDDTPLWILDTSPTAIKGFDGYVTALARQPGLPPIGVITQVSFDPLTTYARLVFSTPRPNPQVEKMMLRQDEARKRLLTEPDVSQYQKAPLPTIKKRANAHR